MVDKQQVRDAFTADPGRVVSALGLRVDHRKSKGDDLWCYDGDESDASLRVTVSGQHAGTYRRWGGSLEDAGDMFALWARQRGYDIRSHFARIVEEVAQCYSIAEAPPKPSGKRWILTEYPVRTAGGELIAVHCRWDDPDGVEPKKVSWRLPDGSRGLQGQIRMADMPLYASEVVAECSDVGRVVWVTEGEKAAASLIARGCLAVGTCGGASVIPSDGCLEFLVGRTVILWPDADPQGIRHMRNIAESLRRLNCEAKVLLPEPSWPKAFDAADWCLANPECPVEALEDDAQECETSFFNNSDPYDEAAGSAFDVPVTDEERRGTRKARPEPQPERHVGRFTVAVEEPRSATEENGAEEERTQYRTEATLAYAFRDIYGAELRCCQKGKLWYYYSAEEGRWIEDKVGRPTRLGMSMMRRRIERVTVQHGSDPSNRDVQFAHNSEKIAVIERAVKAAGTLPPIATTESSFDRHPRHMCLKNGHFSLFDRALEPHSGDWMHSKCSPVSYDPNAECPRWIEFLERTQPDAEMRGFLQRFCGYSLTGLVDEELCVIAYGSGANGKSVFCSALNYIWGGYACTQPSDMLMPSNQGNGGAREDIVRLMGSRIAWVNELPAGCRLDENTLKQLVATDNIVARRLFMSHVEWKPTHHLFIRTNHRPKVMDAGEGVWRRIALVPWEQFIAPEDRVPASVLQAQFENEASGIFNWCLDGLDQYRRIGLSKPAPVEAATTSYRKAEDRLGIFLEDCTEQDGTSECHDKALAEAYREWCDSAGERRQSLMQVNRLMMERFAITRRGSRNYWVGLRLLSGDERPPSDETKHGGSDDRDIEDIWNED